MGRQEQSKVMLWEEEEETWARGWKEYHKSKNNKTLEEAVTMQRGRGGQEKNMAL